MKVYILSFFYFCKLFFLVFLTVATVALERKKSEFVHIILFITFLSSINIDLKNNPSLQSTSSYLKISKQIIKVGVAHKHPIHFTHISFSLSILHSISI